MRMNPDGEKTFLLPMATAQGSPNHPAYPSGHAINLGGYITTLKVTTQQGCVLDRNIVVVGYATAGTRQSYILDRDACVQESRHSHAPSSENGPTSRTTPGLLTLSLRLRSLNANKSFGEYRVLFKRFPLPPGQAFVGFEAGQKCFPNPVESDDGGLARVAYVPTGTEFLEDCVDKDGNKTTGLTIEGELNKVRKTN